MPTDVSAEENEPSKKTATNHYETEEEDIALAEALMN